RQHLGPALTLLRLYKELTKVRRALVMNSEDQEAAKRRPEILFEELSAGALYIEAHNNELVHAITGPKNAETQTRVPEIAKNPSIWSLMRKTAVLFFIAIALVLVFMTWVLAADTVVVGVDLTTSFQVENEFKDSLNKVEAVINSQKSP